MDGRTDLLTPKLVKRYITSLRSESRERPSIWTPGAEPVDFSLGAAGDVTSSPFPAEHTIPKVYWEALFERGGPPLPTLRRAAALQGAASLRVLAATWTERGDRLYQIANTEPDLDETSHQVTLAIAKNPASTADVLLRLANGTPQSLLSRLVSIHSDPPPIAEEIGIAIVRHPNATDAVLEAITEPFGTDLADHFEHVAAEIAQSRLLTPELAKRVGTHRRSAKQLAQNPAIHLYLAAHPHLFQEMSYEAQKSLVRRSDATEALVRRAAEEGSKGLRAAAAQHEKLPPELIEELAFDEMRLVRRAIAMRNDLQEAVVRALASDPHPIIRQTVALKAPNCPESVLQELGQDAAGSVRRAAATHANCPSSLLSELAQDDRPSVREAVAKNPNTPPPDLRRLSDEEEERAVRTGVAQNKCAPGPTLRKLSVTDVYSVRLAVASNTGAPPDVLRAMVEDEAEERRIRLRAQASLQRLSEA